MYDEALGLLRALLSGDPVDHRGTHYRANDVQFLPQPLQDDLPIWIAARWPNRQPLDRASRHEGVFVIDMKTPSDLAAACAHIQCRRSGGLSGFQVVVQGPAGADPEPWRSAGATWWLSAFDPFSVTPAKVRAAINERPGT